MTNKKNSIQKSYTPEEVKKIILEIAVPDGDLKNNLKHIADNIFPSLLNESNNKKKSTSEESNKKITEVLRSLEVDSHAALMESFFSEYRGLAKELSSQIIRDYDCTTSAEKILAEVVANAFIRIIDNSRRLNIELGCPGQTITENKTKYMSMLSIQIDRTNRQFTNALITLKQIKSPAIEMNIKTKNAFIAQNQQINGQGVEKTNNNSETNESK